MNVRVLKFHIQIPYENIVDPYFCLCSIYVPFWSYAPLKTKFEAAPVADWLRSLTSVLLIIRSSHRCGFAPRTGHEFICETSHVLLAGMSGGFSPGTPVFAPPTD